MKVINKTNTTNPIYPKRIICDECGAELEIEESDVHIGQGGMEFVTCPECGKETIVDPETATRKMKPTFPTTFFNYGNGEYSCHLSNIETQKYVDDVMKYKDELEVGSFVRTATGDTCVIGLKHEDEFDIIVAKNYWEDSIFEDEE